MDLTGKKIMLTGSTGGVGQVTAERLADLGAKVLLIDVFPDKLEEQVARIGPERASWYYINLEETETIEPLVKWIYGKEGMVDGFVHSAGIAPMRPLRMTKEADVMLPMRINFLSFMEFVRCLTQKKRFADGGSIVAMSSTGSFHGKPTKAAYSASKAAIDASIRCMICDLKARKIRINSVAPSWVDTPMYRDFLRDYPDSKDIQELQEKQYMGVSDPLEVANVIAFLLSDATKTITGTTIVMDGGISQG